MRGMNDRIVMKFQESAQVRPPYFLKMTTSAGRHGQEEGIEKLGYEMKISLYTKFGHK